MTMSEESQVSSVGFDPLMSDLDEKKQSFRRNVLCLASELREVRSRLASQEQSFEREALSRQEAESKVRRMEEELIGLQRRLEEKGGELQASISASEKCLQQMDALKSQIMITQATADTNVASAQSVQFQCLALLKEFDEKNCSLKENEDRVNRLSERLNDLQKDLQAREYSQKQLRDDVTKIERDITEALAKSGLSKDSELRKLLDVVSPKNIENINKLLVVKDEEIGNLRDEISIMSAHWELKAKELESQLEKQRRVDQELKKRVLKLEFCLQESRSQTRKLQRMGGRRDKAIKELKEQLMAKLHQKSGPSGNRKQNFWESPSFKIVVSMSMLILVVFSKR
ncbi:nuclear envelope-associated protein 2 isoform X1 [Rhodamnia argentea]|uniref:Nuclear envelope-associated protein 2 isoform X1 n=1 Tax=Rhodamnia argentea TaxID=178133 RepID=A0A8B8QZL8_9MYRT|nr:nuclear envelope-associated protein 2 isoform X1 [Rhodamnia argentea]XP_048137067.1 nuclear envelope-associated protein 2 isoform X1 [Rhodamnia argentea]XP_048137068.1 nuclear envelope-associated protein 2 isoform X1 [Rhodamnia argentea]